MMSSSSSAAALAQQRRASTQSAGGLGAGLSDPANPETPEEAAEQFEQLLVRQFVDVMTEDMYSSSMAGDGGGNWMSSQRDRQRDVMTDMITEKLAEAGDLQIAETLLQNWGIESPDAGESSEGASGSSLPDLVDPLPTAPSDTPSSQDRPQIDHAV
jgi:Rod binding domain-containing protein